MLLDAYTVTWNNNFLMPGVHTIATTLSEPDPCFERIEIGGDAPA